MGTTPSHYNHDKTRLLVSIDDDHISIKLRDIQALDASDVCLLKQWLKLRDDYQHIIIDLSDVGYLPSGFFGMLHDHVDSGQRISISNAMPVIQNQVWYRLFINEHGEFIVPYSPWTLTGHST